ncbi:mitochondrial ribonuclease P protein 1 homolog [Diachasma alloeum]|uniref:mitochondrial ribonuclease P protein 1 homolog n=1 Tax=Diachasma alloeum TaxID=454923 RepID=UPI0007383489|nr:mitochondrial ribonuclease P protein 1 homolog [Diachasma alloeum]
MYSRIFRRFLVLSRQLPCKYDAGVKSQVGVSSLLLQNAAKDRRRSVFAGVRHCNTDVEHCNTDVGLKKDDAAQKKLDKWLENPDNEKFWRVLQLEVDVYRQNGFPVPEEIKPRHWYELTLLESRNKRRKYLDFLFGLEKKKAHREEKKQLQRESREQFRATEKMRDTTESPTWLDYRLGRNSPFLRFYESTMNQLGNWRLLRAMIWGQKLVMDCGYEQQMTRYERRVCARQMMLAWAANRDHQDPFDLHFCNFNAEGDVHADFQAFIPTMYDDDFPMNITSKPYLDIFDKDQLVYLTPDCPTELKEIDPDAIYIIGAIVDKVSGRPLSMAKAKRESLKMAKLPIDRYLHFGGGGHKALTLNQMISILLDVNFTNDWEYAFRHVPQRKLFHNRQKNMERRVNKFMKENEEQAVLYSSSEPQDFSIKSRKKFKGN